MFLLKNVARKKTKKEVRKFQMSLVNKVNQQTIMKQNLICKLTKVAKNSIKVLSKREEINMKNSRILCSINTSRTRN